VRGGHAATRRRTLFWIESGLAVLCALLSIVTVSRPAWIEALTGFDPDRRNGSFEWLIVAGLFTASGLAGLAARAEWRRLVDANRHDGYVPL
jgi:hypothetical protein